MNEKDIIINEIDEDILQKNSFAIKEIIKNFMNYKTDNACHHVLINLINQIQYYAEMNDDTAKLSLSAIKQLLKG
jgi:hypothetical protein